MKVESLINARGNAVANQFVITDATRITFQSYKSIIANVDYREKVVEIGIDWDYSNTTCRHRNTFFTDYAGFDTLQNTDAVRKAIKSGTVSHNNGDIFKVVFNSELY